jgi:conjugal transfer pilus assembly protein TrbC
MAKKALLTIFIFVCVGANIESAVAWNANAPTSNVLIFASFSMPKESLRGWLNQADKIKAPVILRGLLHNSFRETTQIVMDTLSERRGGIQIDPTLYKRFHIEKVPAVVVISAECLVNEACYDFDVVYGDVTLDYALKKIVDQNDAFSHFAEIALKQLNQKAV